MSWFDSYDGAGMLFPVNPAVGNGFLTSQRVGGGKAGREKRWAVP